MSALPFLTAFAAFLLFALATDGHHRRRWGTSCPLVRARALRGAAWMLVAIALPLAVLAWGWIFGPIAWIGALMAGAGATFSLLNFALPRRS